MEAWGKESAITAINNSIANGWQGIFPPDQGTSSKPTKTEEESKYKNIF
jgi:hypothetical protein